MAHEQVSIRTADGECPAHVFTPNEGQGPWPAAILYMDAFGIRPALIEMAQHLASGGYVVLLPDLFYRLGAYTLPTPAEVFASGDVRGALGRYFASTDPKRASQDTTAFLAYLDGRPDVKKGKVGVTGYCMGGGMALTAAGEHPDRIGAAAAFHAGGLATDAPTSPHLAMPGIKAKVLIAAAENDNSYPPDMAEKVEDTLRKGGVDYRAETYAGAAHGWTMRDLPVHNPAAEQRHWDELFALFGETLP